MAVCLCPVVYIMEITCFIYYLLTEEQGNKLIKIKLCSVFGAVHIVYVYVLAKTTLRFFKSEHRHQDLSVKSFIRRPSVDLTLLTRNALPFTALRLSLFECMRVTALLLSDML